MLTIDDARRQVCDAITPLPTHTTVALDALVHRVLAQDIFAPMCLPIADNSAMDGFAIRAADVTALPVTLTINQRIPAGHAPKPLAPNTAARIFTGALLPHGADTVVMQENCVYADGEQDNVTINESVALGNNVRSAGMDIQQNALVFPQGHCFTPQDVGTLAALGITSAQVCRRPKVALLSTGDEVIPAGNPLATAQIYDANTPMLKALCEQAGAEVVWQQHILDQREATQAALMNAANSADIIISSGGVSVGGEDHVKAAVEACGELALWKVKLKPGKPFSFGHIAAEHTSSDRSTLFMGLPGNPASAFVTFLLFVLPALQRLQGRMLSEPSYVMLPAQFEVKTPLRRPEFRRVRLNATGVEQHPQQSSGALAPQSWANALAFIPEDTVIRYGDEVRVFPLAMFFR